MVPEGSWRPRAVVEELARSQIAELSIVRSSVFNSWQGKCFLAYQTTILASNVLRLPANDPKCTPLFSVMPPEDRPPGNLRDVSPLTELSKVYVGEKR